MTPSINPGSSPTEIARFINSQDDQTPVSKGHMPEVTKAVSAFFASHSAAIITHVNTTMLTSVRVEYLEGGERQEATLELERPSTPRTPSPSPASGWSSTSPSSASSDSPLETAVIPLEFTKDLESKISKMDLAKGLQNSLLIGVVRHLSTRFTPGTFSDCKLLNFEIKGDWITMDYKKPLERGTYSFNKSVISF
ncbi:MAG: hypothetical protein FJZ59_05495 [Chlamydiae bacterium]|nr:hypothetical protein [Chlamydiota bacterium]